MHLTESLRHYINLIEDPAKTQAKSADSMFKKFKAAGGMDMSLDNTPMDMDSAAAMTGKKGGAAYKQMQKAKKFRNKYNNTSTDSTATMTGKKGGAAYKQMQKADDFFKQFGENSVVESPPLDNVNNPEMKRRLGMIDYFTQKGTDSYLMYHKIRDFTGGDDTKMQNVLKYFETEYTKSKNFNKELMQNGIDIPKFRTSVIDQVIKNPAPYSKVMYNFAARLENGRIASKLEKLPEKFRVDFMGKVIQPHELIQMAQRIYKINAVADAGLESYKNAKKLSASIPKILRRIQSFNTTAARPNVQIDDRGLGFKTSKLDITRLPPRLKRLFANAFGRTLRELRQNPELTKKIFDIKTANKQQFDLETNKLARERAYYLVQQAMGQRPAGKGTLPALATKKT